MQTNARMILICVSAILFSGCSSLLTKDDYERSLSAFSLNQPEAAIETYPEDIEKGFITAMEKTYLNLILGRPEIDDLGRHALKIEDRLRIDLSNNLQSTFYIETPEGYYASEHEIIWMHMLLSWGYGLRGEYEKAGVEARKSAHLLNSPWSEEGGFDDPMMRIVLAGLWTQCGFWEDARVDLRAAFRMNPKLGWVKDLSERETPPKNLFMILGGVGPEAHWDPKMDINSVRGLRRIGFEHKGQKSRLWLSDENGVDVPLYMSPDSRNWYERHLERENAIKELVMDSRYGHAAIHHTAVATGKILTGAVIGLAIASGGIAVGGGLAYLGLVAESGELAVVGGIVALAGTLCGIEFYAKAQKRSTKHWKQDMDSSNTYRFVRYLPEYVWVGWTDSDVQYPVRFETKEKIAGTINTPAKGRTNVSIAHFSDIRSYSEE